MRIKSQAEACEGYKILAIYVRELVLGQVKESVPLPTMKLKLYFDSYTILLLLNVGAMESAHVSTDRQRDQVATHMSHSQQTQKLH